MTLTTTPPTATRERARVSIRPIEVVDADGLSDFYASLSPESRARRFFGACRGISEAEAQRFAAVDHDRDHGYLAVIAEPGPADGQIVGHATLTSAGDAAPEIAFAVADAWQGQGIGTDLLRTVVRAAERRGLPRVRAMLLADNLGMRRLLARAGRPWRVIGGNGSFIEVEIDLEPVMVAGSMS
jgi:acetyltransferase